MICPDCGGKRRRLRRYNPDPYELSPKEIHMMRLQRKAEELARGGMYDRDIAEQLGISRHQVRKWIQYIIDERAEDRKQLRLRAIELYKELLKDPKYHKGGPGAEVARRLKVPKQTVLAWTKHLKSLRKEAQEQRKRRAIELYKEIGDSGKVTKLLGGLHKATVAKWTRSERQRLKRRAIELFKEIGNASEVARRLGIKRERATNWTKHLRSDRSPLKHQVIELYKEIGNASEVARRLKVPKQTVVNWTKHLRELRRYTRLS